MLLHLPVTRFLSPAQRIWGGQLWRRPECPSVHPYEGGGPRVVVSTAAFHARVWGLVPSLGGLKETKMFLPHPRVKVSIVGSLRDREVACSASDRQGSNFESCVWRTVSSHHPQEVLLAQFSLYVHKGGLKPDSFHFILTKMEMGAYGIGPGVRPRSTVADLGNPLGHFCHIAHISLKYVEGYICAFSGYDQSVADPEGGGRSRRAPPRSGPLKQKNTIFRPDEIWSRMRHLRP